MATKYAGLSKAETIIVTTAYMEAAGRTRPEIEVAIAALPDSVYPSPVLGTNSLIFRILRAQRDGYRDSHQEAAIDVPHVYASPASAGGYIERTRAAETALITQFDSILGSYVLTSRKMVSGPALADIARDTRILASRTTDAADVYLAPR